MTQKTPSSHWSESTTGLCPECLRDVPARLFENEGQIWIEQSCTRHGISKSLIASDSTEYLRLRQYVPGRVSAACCCGPGESCDPGKPPVCILLIEITQACNLRCPTCYADAHGHDFMSVGEVKSRLDSFFAREQSRLDVLMISGGEPTIHPDFEAILDLVLSYPIDRILVNTNGLRLAQSDAIKDILKRRRKKVELYLSLSSFRPEVHARLYGRNLLAEKRLAVERAKEAGLFVTIVATVEAEINDDELGDLYKFCLSHENINGLSIQPVMDNGRYDHAESFRPTDRMSMTGAIAALYKQTEGALLPTDFVGLPCSHPDCCALTYGFLDKSRLEMLPLPRILDVGQYLDLFADRISFSGLVGSAARRLLSDLARRKGRKGVADISALFSHESVRDLIPLFGKPEKLGKRVFRIVIKPFMDAHTYDHKRIDQCCTKIIDENGEAVSFCEYNVFRRGRLPKANLIPLAMAKVGAPNERI